MVVKEHIRKNEVASLRKSIVQLITNSTMPLTSTSKKLAATHITCMRHFNKGKNEKLRKIRKRKKNENKRKEIEMGNKE